MLKMLAREESLRLCSETQLAYTTSFAKCPLMLVHLIQLVVVREFGFPDSYINILRTAVTMYPREEISFESLPHYVRFNRCWEGRLKVGDEAPNVPLFHLRGEIRSKETDMHSILCSIGSASLVVIAGSGS
jgi:hypothetical protein